MVEAGFRGGQVVEAGHLAEGAGHPEAVAAFPVVGEVLAGAEAVAAGDEQKLVYLALVAAFNLELIFGLLLTKENIRHEIKTTYLK